MLSYRQLIISMMIISLLVSCSNQGQSSKNQEEAYSAIVEKAGPETNKHLVEICNKDSLVVYYPHFSRIDLVTGSMPEKTDSNVIFVCEAAFTGQCMDEFKHSNISGNHVSSGIYYTGYKCKYGVFTWSLESGWQFNEYNDSESALKKAAEEGGMGFYQGLLFHNGERRKGIFKDASVNIYRAVCELNGKLCIVDCSRALPFKSFMDGLQKLGVTDAIYCDMGSGWNYSWYRQDDGTVKELFCDRIPYTTNWITFYAD